jgi:hypothetical protein
MAAAHATSSAARPGLGAGLAVCYNAPQAESVVFATGPLSRYRVRSISPVAALFGLGTILAQVESGGKFRTGWLGWADLGVVGVG